MFSEKAKWRQTFVKLMNKDRDSEMTAVLRMTTELGFFEPLCSMSTTTLISTELIPTERQVRRMLEALFAKRKVGVEGSIRSPTPRMVKTDTHQTNV